MQKGVISDLEQTTQETVQELQDYSVYVIKHQLEQLYLALKSSDSQKSKQIKVSFMEIFTTLICLDL